LGRKFVLPTHNESMRHALGEANPSYKLQGCLTYNEYTSENRAKICDGRCGTENSPAKAARHFTQL